MGAAHIGEAGFAAGLFYSYICINRDLLAENLDNDQELATRAIQALTEAAVKISPKGKQNSFGSRAYASYVLAESGAQQPRSLSVAFLKPVMGNDYGEEAVGQLRRQRDNFDAVYGPCADDRYEIDTVNSEVKGSLQGLLDFVGRH
jgi:CRISPR system Cascade subunit CasC